MKHHWRKQRTKHFQEKRVSALPSIISNQALVEELPELKDVNTFKWADFFGFRIHEAAYLYEIHHQAKSFFSKGIDNKKIDKKVADVISQKLDDKAKSRYLSAMFGPIIFASYFFIRVLSKPHMFNS